MPRADELGPTPRLHGFGKPRGKPDDNLNAGPFGPRR